MSLTKNLIDRSWIRQAFLLPSGTIDEADQRYRMASKGIGKFSDTSLGGSPSINPVPQFCKNADVAEERVFYREGLDMGRAYSEHIEDNQVLVHLRAGVPAFNSLTQFFANFYNPEASQLARTGRSSTAYFIGSVVGTVFTIPFLPFVIAGQAFRYLIGKPSTKFYYLKPAMPLFWNTLNSMVNTYAAQKGMVEGYSSSYGPGEVQTEMSPDEITERNKLLPAIWRSGKSNVIDVYAIGTRYQYKANRQYEAILKYRESMDSQFLDSEATRKGLLEVVKEAINSNRETNMSDHLAKYFAEPAATPDLRAETGAVEATEVDGKSTFESLAESVSSIFGTAGDSTQPSFWDFMNAEFRDGSQFITYRVENPGDRSESFSNSVKDSELKGAIDGMSTSSRAFKFNVAGGNVASNVVTDTVAGVINVATDLISGIGNKLGMSGLGSLAGNAMVDIPKYWDSSSANLPRHNYTVVLQSPYQNEICRLQTLIIPMFGLLAMALPLSAGAQSYTSPFLIEAYCQGRAQTRLSMFDSIDITSSDFTNDGRPLTITINFSLVDMSSIMHMPLVSGFNPVTDFINNGISKWITSDDTVFSDYMAITASASLTSQIYPMAKMRRNFYKTLADWDSWTSPSHVANWVGGWLPSRLIAGLYNQTSR